MTLLTDLSRARVTFQQRTILMILEEKPITRCANTEALSAHYDQPDPIGQEDGETCGRYAEPDDDTPSAIAETTPVADIAASDDAAPHEDR
jgi:hypothetical protein